MMSPDGKNVNNSSDSPLGSFQADENLKSYFDKISKMDFEKSSYFELIILYVTKKINI